MRGETEIREEIEHRRRRYAHLRKVGAGIFASIEQAWIAALEWVLEEE